MTNCDLVASLENVAVQLNWLRMLSEQWPVSVSNTTAPTDLAMLQMPWYLDSNACEVMHDDARATTVSVERAAQNLRSWSLSKQRRIIQYAAIFRATKEPLQITLPVYRLPKGHRLLLDGNHRAVALQIVKRAVEVTLLSIEGPNEVDALPDVKHWQS